MAQLVTLEQVRTQIDDHSTDNSVELGLYIDAATEAVERFTGPVLNRVVTEKVAARGTRLALSQVPVVELASIAPVLTGGLAVEVAELDLDGDTGVVTRLDGGQFYGGPWRVTYTAGRGDTVPPTIQLAALLLIHHLWRTKYGAARAQGSQDDFSVTEQIPGFGYAVPYRVLTLLEPYQQPPGIA
ncbi:hypothetical protein ABZV68_13270 [Streptomyces clavifer]|uniref:hypothetical protein n=1 Tax=Streptomyces clavifer TaxID=68188 RepID=UPI0033A7FB7F